jgi:hypothetical protein
LTGGLYTIFNMWNIRQIISSTNTIQCPYGTMMIVHMWNKHIISLGHNCSLTGKINSCKKCSKPHLRRVNVSNIVFRMSCSVRNQWKMLQLTNSSSYEADSTPDIILIYWNNCTNLLPPTNYTWQKISPTVTPQPTLTLYNFKIPYVSG